MDWINNYDLFLFDMDGLLIDSEPIHYQAYKEMAARHGVEITWDFPTYCGYAHRDADSLSDALITEYPRLSAFEFRELYLEKKAIYHDLVRSQVVPLMPGVEEVLGKIFDLGKGSCIVTHSPRDHVEQILANNPILRRINHSLAREDYDQPKPNPDPYRQAIERFLPAGGRAIGFEDSLRGYRSLSGTSATPVLICSRNHPQLQLPEMSLVELYTESFYKVSEII